MTSAPYFICSRAALAAFLGAVADAFGARRWRTRVRAGTGTLSQCPPVDPIACTGDQHARACRQAVVDGVAQRDVDVVAGTDVAHGGDAGLQRDLALCAAWKDCSTGKRIIDVVEAAGPVGVVVVGDMRVRIDEAGQQRRVAEVDDARARRGCGASPPTASMLVPRTTMRPGDASLPLRPSNRCAACSTMGAAAAGAGGSDCAWVASAPPRQAAKHTRPPTRRRMRFPSWRRRARIRESYAAGTMLALVRAHRREQQVLVVEAEIGDRRDRLHRDRGRPCRSASRAKVT